MLTFCDSDDVYIDTCCIIDMLKYGRVVEFLDWVLFILQNTRRHHTDTLAITSFPRRYIYIAYYTFQKFSLNLFRRENYRKNTSDKHYKARQTKEICRLICTYIYVSNIDTHIISVRLISMTFDPAGDKKKI